jgi:hypothetical protein
MRGASTVRKPCAGGQAGCVRGAVCDRHSVLRTLRRKASRGARVMRLSRARLRSQRHHQKQAAGNESSPFSGRYMGKLWRRIACGNNGCTVRRTGGTGAMGRRTRTKRAGFEQRLPGWCYDWTRYMLIVGTL